MAKIRFELNESGNKRWWSVFGPVLWLAKVFRGRPIKVDERKRSHVDVNIRRKR